MTYASVRDAAQHIARTGTITPHQIAAFTALWESMTDSQKQQFTELWRAAGSPAAKPTAAELITMAQAVMVFGKAPTAAQLADLNDCLIRFKINTPVRMRHFMAQLGHESGGLRWMLELASGEAYEGRQDLGNTQKGDGPRFKGAGALQLTGRYNYQSFSDFIKDSRVMNGAHYVSATYPFTSAGFWWHTNAMNAFVDQGATCRQVSAKVNGRDPANGLDDREAYFARAVAAIPQSGRPPVEIQQPAKITPASLFSTRLTPHVTLGEFALGQEARRFQHQYQVDTAAELAAFLERCRKEFGGKPVIITSGYRPAAINKSVGGASGSEHLYDAPGVGAVDFLVKGVSVKAVQDWCDREWPFSVGYGAQKGFVHLGLRAGRPRVRWDY